MWGLVTGETSRNGIRSGVCKEGKLANKYSWLFTRMDLMLMFQRMDGRMGRLDGLMMSGLMDGHRTFDF